MLTVHGDVGTHAEMYNRLSSLLNHAFRLVGTSRNAAADQPRGGRGIAWRPSPRRPINGLRILAPRRSMGALASIRHS